MFRAFALTSLLISSFSVYAQTEPVVAQPEETQAQATPPPAPKFEPKVFVTVDKFAQSITIVGPGLDQPWVDAVSTGGGFKNPTGRERPDAQPYCATTTAVTNFWIPAREGGRNPTMKRVHYSKLFEDDNGNQVAMPNAIYIQNGEFFHTAPKNYIKYLGQNVSGGCIRLHPKTSKLLYSMMKENGGILVNIINDDPPMSKGQRNYCTAKQVAQAKARKLAQARERNWWEDNEDRRRSSWGWNWDDDDEDDRRRDRERDRKRRKRDREYRVFTNPLGW